MPIPAAEAMVSTLSCGACGHTGRFVVAELRERGHVPLLLGRDQDKLPAPAQSGLEARQASVDDPASLDRALNGAAARCPPAVRHPRGD